MATVNICIQSVHPSLSTHLQAVSPRLSPQTSLKLPSTEAFGSICFNFQYKEKHASLFFSYHWIWFRSVDSACFCSTGRSVLTRKQDLWAGRYHRSNWLNNRWCWDINWLWIYFTFHFHPQWTIPNGLFWLWVTDSWKKTEKKYLQIKCHLTQQ